MKIIESIGQVGRGKKKEVFLKYLIIACLVSASNVLFCFNQIASYAVIAAETLFLIYILFTKDLAEYISYFMIFMCNCIEFAAFTGEENFYSFKNFRIAGINLGIIMLLPIFAFGIMNIGKVRVNLRLGRFDFVRGLILINVVAFVVGLLLVFTNDNNIISLGSMPSLFLGETYTMVFLPLAFIVAFGVIKKRYRQKMYLVGLALQATLWANVFQMIVSLLGGIAGSYGYLSTLQGSILNFFIPLLIIYRFFDDNVVFPRMTSAIGLIGSLIAVAFNANGKIILLFFICILVYWWYSFKNGSTILRIFTFIVIIGGFGAIPFAINFLRTNALFNAKFEEVSRLLNIFSGDWLNGLNMSVRVRVEEFRNVFIEYSKKPWLIISGKGYLGSILDHTGFFTANITSADGFVSETEFVHRIYYALHEGSKYLLMYGAIGVAFMLRFIGNAFKRIRKSANVPLIIGAYWFILFYGYSFTLSTFGIIALLYGYNYKEERLQFE